ncbi:MAG: PQQ-binding-like beta-propeller repeat protein, partial [Pseudomonadota bacterium]|nr:PQQ-binding-like beta-propeller repeat protein [Pseudomonadota bacterium]
MMPRVLAVFLIVAAGPSLTACGLGYLGDIEDDLILPGERIPIVVADDAPKVDDSLAEKPVALPPPRLNADWPQVGGDAGHAVGHLALDYAPQQVWRRRVGRGSDDRRRLGTPPVVAEGRVFTVDTDGQVAAFNLADGRALWRTATVTGNDDERTLFAGGLARVGEMVLLARGDGRLIALAAADGRRRWSVATGTPLRGAPVVDGDRAVVVGLNNTAQAHAIEDGRLLWQHRGFDESATVFGGASAAMSGPWAVVPYSSGEVFALRRTNGRVVWADNFSAYRGGKGLTSMATIGGYPVIDRDMVLVSSHSGR